MKHLEDLEKFKRIPRAMCVAALGVSALLAWSGRIQNPAVLAGFFMAGVSLWYLPEEETSIRSKRIMVASAFFVIGVGLLELNLYFGARQAYLSRPHLAPMVPMSGISFLMIGFALIFMHSRRNYWLARLMIVVTTIFSLVTGVSYAYGIRSLYVIGPYLGLAPVFLILCLGLLFAHR